MKSGRPRSKKKRRRRIARRIVQERRKRPLRTAAEVADIVRRCVPKSKGAARIDAATRTFQALRIAVNDELKSLEIALRRLPDCLSPGGRIAIISFHSLEDRRVKHAFRDDDRLEVITRKPIRPGELEIQKNPRLKDSDLAEDPIRTFIIMAVNSKYLYTQPIIPVGDKMITLEEYCITKINEENCYKLKIAITLAKLV